MMRVIYKATNTLNNMRYIGQTTQCFSIRKEQHKKVALNNSKLHFHNALRKYGTENFEWKIIACCDNLRLLSVLEKFCIDFFCTIRNGYNMIPGGNTSPMLIPEVAKKHGDAIRGIKKGPNPEQSKRMMGNNNPAKNLIVRKKISESKKREKNPNYGKKLTFSKERNKLISEKLMGRKFTEEHKKKLSKSAKARNKNRGRDKFGRFI